MEFIAPVVLAVSAFGAGVLNAIAGGGTFLTNSEKEVLFMPQGIAATYQGTSAPVAPAYDDLF